MSPQPKSPQQAFEYLKKYLKDNNKNKKGKQGSLEAEKNHIVFERLIHRLAIADEQSWALKGGMLMNIRNPETSRATQDVDISYWGLDKDISYNEIKDILMRDLSKNTGDMFSFNVCDVKKATIVDKEAGTKTATYLVQAMLGNNLVTSFHLDIGVSDKPYSCDNVSYKTGYSDFMGYAQSVFPAISKEQHFAEKVHAYTKPMDKFENMRFKDLFDMSVLIDSGLDEDLLKNTMEYVFSIRGTHDIPKELIDPPVSWKGLYNKIAKEHGLNETIDESVDKVKKYFEDFLKIHKDKTSEPSLAI